jgi:hypothetical protein
VAKELTDTSDGGFANERRVTSEAIITAVKEIAVITVDITSLGDLKDYFQWSSTEVGVSH